MDKGSGMGFVVLYYNDAGTLLKALVWPVYTTANPQTHPDWIDNAPNSERVDDWNLADSQVGERELNVSGHKPAGATKIKIKAIIENVNVGDFWVDLFRVRKYSTSEPTVTIGDEIASGMFSSSGWNHIAQTYDGSTQKLYLNGVLVASQPLSGEITANANDLLIGNMFNGTIDEVRLWNVARTEEEIRANMCKKLSGSENGLVGYWRLDEGTGTVANDATGNNNGILTNSPTWVWSGAAIGDASAYDYEGTQPEDFSVNLAHTDGDNFTVTGESGTITGIQVYRIDETAMRDGSIKPSSNWKLDPYRYWGVFAIGTDPTYSLTYQYGGHPGIDDESDLGLAKRDNLADDSWEDANATLDAENNSLVLTNQSGTEYALGSKTGKNNFIITKTSDVKTNHFSLFQNQPNPFVTSTMIRYELPERSSVTLKVYDLFGREVTTLFEGEQNACKYEVEFNGTSLPGGIYFYQLQAGNFMAVRKLLLLK